MAIASHDIGIQCLQVHGNLPRRVRGIDDGQDSPLASAPADRLHWKARRGRRGDMAQIDHFRSRCDPLPESLDDFFFRWKRQRNGLANVACPHFSAVEFPGVITGAVFMVRGQDFITRFQFQ